MAKPCTQEPRLRRKSGELAPCCTAAFVQLDSCLTRRGLPNDSRSSNKSLCHWSSPSMSRGSWPFVVDSYSSVLDEKSMFAACLVSASSVSGPSLSLNEGSFSVSLSLLKTSSSAAVAQETGFFGMVTSSNSFLYLATVASGIVDAGNLNRQSSTWREKKREEQNTGNTAIALVAKKSVPTPCLLWRKESQWLVNILCNRQQIDHCGRGDEALGIARTRFLQHTRGSYQ